MYQASYSSYNTPTYGRFQVARRSTFNSYARMKVYYLMDYLPTRYDASPEQARNRRAIYDFKDGCCPSSIVDGFASGIRRLGDYNTVVCFIPASTQFKTQRRYANLASRLSTLTGKRCSYTAISKSEDSESGHIAGKSDNPAADFRFDSSFFSGKKVILVDDVMTRGRTLEGTARRLKELGASEVVGLVAGITINPDWTGAETRNVERL